MSSDDTSGAKGATSSPTQPAASAGPQEPAGDARAPSSQARGSANPARRVTLAVLLAIVALFAYGIVADRTTPYTSQATVQAYLVQIAPEVGGKVIEVGVEEGRRVDAGAVLFRINPEYFLLAVRRAEAQLELAGQNIGASTASVAAAQAAVTQAKVERDNVREQSDRILTLVEQGIYAPARGDQAKAAINSAEAAVTRALAQLEEARQNLGPEGEDNPQVREALAALEKAQLDLAKTAVAAPAEGVVPFLELAVGQVLAAGQTAMTYVDIRQIWIDAAFRENSLEYIEEGDLAEIVFDIRPGRVYQGRVESLGYAVANRAVDVRTGLPTVRNPSGWFRDPQPMPLRIALDAESRPRNLRLGSQATVVVYAQDAPITNWLGYLWIRVLAWFTYVN
ncbi:MAG: HlyD family secretion protein [Kiloniellaceae bacterium]